MNRIVLSICSITAVGIAAGLFVSRGYGQGATIRTDIQVATVRDLNTRLTWQRTIAAGTFSFEGATGYCADLDLAGHDDWRLPSMQEFQTLVDESRTLPTIDVAAFPETPSAGFWSGTPWAGTPLAAWHVDFDTGSAAYDTSTMPYHVRCVRWEP
jgi:hypothetical protein